MDAPLQFKRKPAKIGKYYVLWIPATYIHNGLVNPELKYMVKLEPITDEVDSQPSNQEKPKQRKSAGRPKKSDSQV
ncbi:MAG TPA: hypothetical protein VKM55_22105 [Candidatus Lokiarchaeia archaeon]|nr:hypothetical protein [Candidatus Lokiarchaeia archaeon]